MTSYSIVYARSWFDGGDKKQKCCSPTLWIPRRSLNSMHILLLRNWFPLENRRKEQTLIALTSTQLTHVFTTSLREVFMKKWGELIKWKDPMLPQHMKGDILSNNQQFLREGIKYNLVLGYIVIQKKRKTN